MNTSAARSALRYALVLGLAADLLLRDGPLGIGFPIWITLLVVSMMALISRVGHDARPETPAWLAAAALFSAGLAWRNSEPLQALDVLATGICLGMAAVSLADPQWTLLQSRIRDAIWALWRVARMTAAGIIPVALRASLDARAPGAGRDNARAIVRAAALSAVLLVVFGSLLLNADPIFASFLSIPEIDVATVASHVLVFAFFAWITGGWTRAALDATAIAPLPERFGLALSALDITMSLGTLNVLFAAFLGAQLAWFFGGETYLQAHTGLTASAYARRGFFELVWVAALGVPLILGTRAMISADDAVRRRHTMLSLPLIAMLGAMIMSAVLRMRLYVSYYGLTIERFYPLVFMGWLTIVLILAAISLLREPRRSFLAGAALTGLATLLALNVANPDVIIARVNLDRKWTAASHDATGVDVVHLATLSGEAADIASGAVISATTNASPYDRCVAARALLSRWGPSSARALRRAQPDGWRVWNAGESFGLAAVRRASGALRAVIHATCVDSRSQPPV
jgi:hypothetical protein